MTIRNLAPKFFFLTVLLVNVLGESFVHAATLKVEKVGGTPYATIQSAINDAAAGDTIEIGPGTYAESVSINISVNLIGYGPQHVLITGGDNGHGIVVEDGITTTIIKAVTVTSRNQYGVVILTRANVKLSHCVITATAVVGVQHDSEDGRYAGQGARIVLDHCTIAKCKNTGVYVRTNGGSSGSVSLYDSIISDNAKDAPWSVNINCWADLHHILLNGKPSTASPIPNSISGVHGSPIPTNLSSPCARGLRRLTPEPPFPGRSIPMELPWI